MTEAVTIATSAPAQVRWLLIDDDAVLLRTLARSLERQGDALVRTAENRREARAIAESFRPQRIVLDLKLGEDNGLDLVGELKRLLPGARIVLLTGYASITTAVDAIRRGAWNYLPKPIDLGSLLAAFETLPPAGEEADALPENEADRASLKQLEWEHIQRVLAEYGGNVSAAARALGMYRRTLQRKLAKKAP